MCPCGRVLALQLLSALLALGAPLQAGTWRWNPVFDTGTRPSKRQGHASVALQNRVYVIGGCSHELRCHNDVHAFDTNAFTWTLETLTGETPEPRGGHTASLLGTDIFVFGGANSEETFGDTHRLDLVSGHWSRLAAEGPQRRTGHAAAAADGRVYVFGGYTVDGRVLDDLWALDVRSQEWHRPALGGRTPVARGGHSLTLVGRRLLLFGGYAACGSMLGDTHLLDLETQQWSEVVPQGATPEPRRAHAAAARGMELVVAGGCDASRCYGDAWSLSLADVRWTRRAGAAALEREGHSVEAVHGTLFVFGGCGLGAGGCFEGVAEIMEPCPGGCSGRGRCLASGACYCQPGFEGPDCSQPVAACPQSCCSHGTCEPSGCRCKPGWHGASCSLPSSTWNAAIARARSRLLREAAAARQRAQQLQLLLQAVAAAKSGQWVEELRLLSSQAQEMMLVAQAAEAQAKGVVMLEPQDLLGLMSSCAHSVANNSAPAPAGSVQLVANHTVPLSLTAFRSANGTVPPVRVPGGSKRPQDNKLHNRDFGVEDLSGLSPSDYSIDCEDNCNFQGLCDAGVCYCQPGYSGETCLLRKLDDQQTLSVFSVLIIAGTCLLISFAMTLTALYWRQKQKFLEEEGLGYKVGAPF